MNVEQLRKQAKELVRAARSGDERARARIHVHAGRRDGPLLADAQLTLARERGYPSWPRLVAGAEANADAFVVAATSRRRGRAEAMLEALPEIGDDPWASLVLGRKWDGDPTTPGGPRGWAPLLYVCHSCFANADLAGALLEGGADPNAFFVNEYGRMSALYGAAGVVHDAVLTRLLLEAGADPDDGESLYHSTEAESAECLRLLLSYGAGTRGTNALPHALDFPHLEHVRALLEAGADPDEGPYVAHAVRRGRDPEHLRLLAEFGADLDRPGGEMWRRPAHLRTPFQHALIRGRADQTETLAALGADTTAADGDEAIASIARGERPAGTLAADLDFDAQEAVIGATLNGHVDVVVDAVGPDFMGVVGGSPGGTLLHHVAWVGRVDLVEQLLARGADVAIRSDATYDTPLAWAALASGSADASPGAHVAVAEVLVAAGDPIEERFLDVAGEELREWLEERLV
jgi:ankyrin repeat protein